jgi:uncharacterized membrane protein YhaH (DUF805 family)
MHWMLMPLRRYADFAGRSRRKEYWMFALMNIVIWSIILLLGLWGVEERLFSSDEELSLYFIVTGGLYSLATLVPSLAVTVRRLHDTDKSGWLILLSLIPLIGPLILLVFYVTAGTEGANRFGSDPLGGPDAAAAA